MSTKKTRNSTDLAEQEADAHMECVVANLSESRRKIKALRERAESLIKTAR